MFWRRGYTLRGEVGGGWALEFPSFLGPVKWHRADRRVPFQLLIRPWGGLSKMNHPLVTSPLLTIGGLSESPHPLPPPHPRTYLK